MSFQEPSRTKNNCSESSTGEGQQQEQQQQYYQTPSGIFVPITSTTPKLSWAEFFISHLIAFIDWGVETLHDLIYGRPKLQ